MRMILGFFVAVSYFGVAFGQSSGVAHGTIFGDITPRGNAWTEDVPNNLLYHNDGGGTRRFILNGNAATGVGGSSYLTVVGNVSSGFVNATVMSPFSTALTGYVYKSGSGSAQHFYSAGNSSWHLLVDGEPALSVDADRDLNVTGGVDSAFVLADEYLLRSPRIELAWVTQYDVYASVSSGGRLYRIDLPNGSSVISAELIATDNNTIINFAVQLVAVNSLGSFVPTPIVSLVTSGYSSAKRSFVSTAVTGGLVNTDLYSYYLLVSPEVDSFPNLLLHTFRVKCQANEL